MLKLTGLSFLSKATKEHVASKPIAIISFLFTFAIFKTLFTDLQTLFHISSEDCSTKFSSYFFIFIFVEENPFSSPFKEKIPALALPEPTSIPITYFIIKSPIINYSLFSLPLK